MGQTIKIRRDSAASWVASNPILSVGEMGWNTGEAMMKIGDGVTRWNSLPYMSGQANGFQTFNIAVSTLTNIAHGWGVAPWRVTAHLTCAVANNGYSVGDIVTPNVPNFSISANATNVSLSMGSLLPSIIPRAGGAAVAIVAANWQILVRAERR